MKVCYILLVGFLGSLVEAGLIQKNVWNDLKVTWGVNPLTSYTSLPLSESDAIKNGWVRDSKNCSQVNGVRYTLNNDRSTLLIYDARGQLAGLASSIPKNLPFGYPSKKLQKFFNDEGDVYTITAYFIDPSTVCSSNTPLKQNKIGDRLIIKSSSYEMNIPLDENSLSDSWTRGKCFVTMGVHYWGDVDGLQVDSSTSNENLMPFFLLYNQGQLNAFGWSFNALLNSNSNRYEHPTSSVFGLFFNSVPAFLSDSSKSGGVSTMHIYLDSTPEFDWC